MATRYIITEKRSKYPLVFVEISVGCAILSYWLCKQFTWDWLLGIVIFFVASSLIGVLFFRVRIFRYIFAILFSLFWGFLGYVFSTEVTKSAFTPWIVMLIVFMLSLISHRSYFNFEKNAERVTFRES